MKTLRLICTGIAISALITLGACSNNGQNSNENTETENGHDHSLMRENPDEMDQNENMHEEHEAIKDKFAHQDLIVLDPSYQAGAAEKESLHQVVAAYLKMKNEFVNDNLQGIDNAVTAMKQKVNEVGGELLKNEGEKAWRQHSELYNRKLDEMAHIKGLEAKRSYFSHISEIVYCTIKSFDLAGDQTLYATFCPMAFDGKGAYWVSETEEIRNPYFGKKMLKCGSIKEEL